MKKLLLATLFLINAFSSIAQTDNYGTEFWTGFMTNYDTIGSIRLYIAAKQTTDVTISVPLKGYFKKINILKDSIYIFIMPHKVAHTLSKEVVDQTGIHVVSDYPIAITAMNLRQASTDATVVFPLKNIPVNTVYITGHPKAQISNEFLLVSPENGVQVEINPTANTTKYTAFKPFTITLDEGETFQVVSGSTMDGTSIKVLNNKRIIVYSGDKCSNFPCGACDHQVEQLFPNQILDTAYYAIPHWGHKKGYVVKVVTIDTTIYIKVNGKQYRVGRRDSALVLDVPSGDSVLHISGPRPFSCFQFLKGANCNGYATSGFGDPSMLQIFSAKSMGQNSTFISVNTSLIKDHLLSIIVYTASINDVYMDGTRIAASEFIPVSHNKNFSYAMFKLNPGVHKIYCQLGHLGYCYGVGGAESYLYNGGFSLPNFEIDIKDSVLSFNCKENKVNMQFTAKLDGAIKQYRWDFGDGTYDSTKVVTHKYEVGKEFTIKLWALGYNAKEDSVIKKFTFHWPEFNPVMDKLLCDQQYTFEEKNPFFANFKWQDNSTKNYYTTTKTEKVWVTATDTTGYCKFSDTAQVNKVGVVSTVKVDTLSNCHLNNLFKFSDSSYVINDKIMYKVWIFPGGVSFYNTTNFYYHFRQPGKFTVYLDIYPEKSPCKSRIEIPVTINWNTDKKAILPQDKFCNGEMATIIDTSYSCCQKVKKYYWEVEGSPKVSSFTKTLKTNVYYDYKASNGIRNFKYITETYQGCRDTIKSSLIVWPAAPAKFDLGPDSIKCLALSRWTFTHTVNENLTGPYTMFWNFGNGKTGTQNQYKNFRYTDTGLHKITLTTTTSIGCKDSVSRYVRAIPNAVAKFSIPDTIQCLANNSIIVNDSSIGYNLKYTWDFGKSNPLYSPNPSAQHYLFPGIYKVKLNVVSNYAGCFADSVFHTVHILRPPKADFKFNADTFCLRNNSVSMTDKSVFYYGKYKLYWNYAGNIDSAFSPMPISFIDTGKYAVMLVVKDSMGCLDTISKVISIKPEPVLKMSINDTVQCFGVNNFDVKSLQTKSIKNRIWTLNNILISGNQLQKNIVDLKPEGIYKITLNEETPFGCKDSITKFIEVLPPLKVFIGINNFKQCFSQQSVDLNDKSVVLKDIIKTYTYKEDGTVIGNTSDIINYKFKTFGTKVIKLYIETENGCKDSGQQTLYLLNDPKASFTSDSVCLGESITLKGLQAGGSSIKEWKWNMGDGINYGPNKYDTMTHTYKNAGKYFPEVTFIDDNDCNGEFKGNPVVIYPLPKPDFGIKILASDEQYSFVKLIPKNLGYFSYLWTFPDKTNNTLDTPTVKVSRFFKDRISLKVESAFGCIDTGSQFLYIFPKLTNLYFENAFTPNGDLLNETFKPYSIDGAENYILRIYDRWGEQLFSSTDPKLGWNGTYKNSEVQAGVYIFTVEFKYADGNRYSTRGNVTVVR